MAVNEKLSGNLTVDGTITQGGNSVASLNPTPGVYPICYNDFTGSPSIFANGGLRNSVIMTPMGYSYLGLMFEDNYSFLGTLLELNPMEFVYTFGQAGYQLFSGVSADGGMSIYPNIGDAIIGCGISSPSNGVFKASGAQQTITIGTNPSSSIGAAPTLGSGSVSALYIGQDLVYSMAGQLYLDVYIPTIGNKRILLS